MVKRRCTAFFMAFTILAAAAAAVLPARADDVCFVAVNDQLPPELGFASYSAGSLYVPYESFSSFGIYYTLYTNAAGSVIGIYTSNKQFYFDLTTGETTDAYDKVYSASGAMIGGHPYVPVAFVCGEFGLSWSYIPGTGNGDICRIKDSRVVLDDSMFISAADQVMANRRSEYVSGMGGADFGNAGTDNRGDRNSVYLSFMGLPSDELIERLKNCSVKATFFVDENDVLSNPDLIRRICGEGHGIGVKCSGSPAEEYARTSELIFEAARVKTVLVAPAAPEYNLLCMSAAEECGLVCSGYTAGGKDAVGADDVIAQMQYYPERADIRVCCDSFPDECVTGIISYALSKDFNFLVTTEINALPLK